MFKQGFKIRWIVQYFHVYKERLQLIICVCSHFTYCLHSVVSSDRRNSLLKIHSHLAGWTVSKPLDFLGRARLVNGQDELMELKDWMSSCKRIVFIFETMARCQYFNYNVTCVRFGFLTTVVLGAWDSWRWTSTCYFSGDTSLYLMVYNNSNSWYLSVTEMLLLHLDAKQWKSYESNDNLCIHVVLYVYFKEIFLDLESRFQYKAYKSDFPGPGGNILISLFERNGQQGNNLVFLGNNLSNRWIFSMKKLVFFVKPPRLYVLK